MIKRTPAKKKKVKKPSLNELKKKLWKHFSLWIRKRDNYTCYTCGKVLVTTPSLCQAGHYVPQSAGSALRYDPRNVHAQCVTCNSFRHGNLHQYALRLEQQYGAGILQEFETIRHQPKKWTHDELEELIRRYKEDE